MPVIRGSLRRSAVALATAVLLGLTAAEGAAAAKPFTLDDVGDQPSIAVDGARAGHLAWNEEGPGSAGDTLHYCKLPRGAKSCSIEKLLPIPDQDFDGPEVVLGGGEVILVSHRCCSFPSPLTKTYVMRSTNGGVSFSPPKAIGSSEMSFGGGAYFGPGGFSVSTIGSETGGTFFQAAPLGAATPVEARANLSAATGKIGYEGSIAFLNPLTPIAAFTDLDNLFARRYDGTGDYNAIANWGPLIPLGPGDEPRLASGLKGTYLIYRLGQPGRRVLKVKRYDPATRQFVSATRVSRRGEPIERDFLEDVGGNLHAAWIDNGDPDKVRYRRSVDGERWGDTKTLERNRDRSYWLDVGASDDGGGWVVWTTGSGDSAIRAAPFGRVGPGEGGGGECVPKLTYGKAVALASEGCFKRKGTSKTYATSGSARLNGLDLDPGGSSATAAAKSKLEINVGKGTVTSDGPVQVSAGNVVLDKGKLAMKLPKGAGQIRDLAGNPAVFDTAGAEYLGLPVSGQTSPRIVGGESIELPAHLKLPSPFSALLGGAVTGDTMMTLRNSAPGGLVIQKGDIKLEADNISLGIAEVKNLSITYVGDPWQLRGSGALRLPVTGEGASVNFGLEAGGFDYGNAIWVFPGNGIPVATLVYLKQLGFSIQTDPLRLAGSGRVIAGSQVAGKPLLSADGTVSYTFPKAPNPGIFRIDGTGAIVGIKALSAFAQYKTSGRLDVGGGFSAGIGPASLNASTKGAVDLNSGAFTLTGSGAIKGLPLFGNKSVGVEALLSNKALAGCGTLDPPALPAISGGGARYWQGGFTLFGGCNLSPFKTVSAGISATQKTFTLGKRLPAAGIVVDGTTAAPPRVRLVGPGGQVLEASASVGAVAHTAVGAIHRFGVDGNTYAQLVNPAAGTWRVETVSGGNEIGSVRTADGLVAPKVTARVKKRSGRKRILRYEIRSNPGQRVTFFEQGPGVVKRLGSVRGDRGKLKFKAADGPKGRRLITASVSSGDVPRAVLDVTGYVAPKPIRPAKPKKLRAKRRGSKLKLSWRKARNAKRYAIAVKLKDGRRLSILTRKRRTTIKKVPGIDSARIKVAGLKADNTPGKAARAKLRAKPKKRRKARR